MAAQPPLVALDSDEQRHRDPLAASAAFGIAC
jgi:hypothetical protein